MFHVTARAMALATALARALASDKTRLVRIWSGAVRAGGTIWRTFWRAVPRSERWGQCTPRLEREDKFGIAGKTFANGLT